MRVSTLLFMVVLLGPLSAYAQSATCMTERQANPNWATPTSPKTIGTCSNVRDSALAVYTAARQTLAASAFNAFKLTSGRDPKARLSFGTTTGTVPDSKMLATMQSNANAIFPANKINWPYDPVTSPDGTARTMALHSRNHDDFDQSAVNVKNAPYNAKGDGITNDTKAINAAFATGLRVIIPSGTYAVCGVTIISAADIQGFGKYGTVLKALPGCNSDVVSTSGAETKFGSSVDGVDGWSMSYLTIDGNRANQNTSSKGSRDTVNCLAVYSGAWRLEHVILQNCLGHGMHTGWQQYGENKGGVEADIDDVTIDTTGRHGWWYSGPHDIQVRKMVIIDASQETDNMYDGLYTDGYSGGQISQFHAWHRNASTNRMKFDVSSAGHLGITNSDFEGARAWFEHRGDGDRVSNSAFYAPFGFPNKALILFEGNNSLDIGNIYRAKNGVNSYAMQFGIEKHPAFSTQIKSVYFTGFKNGPFLFINDGGHNWIDGAGYNNSAKPIVYTGEISQTDAIHYREPHVTIDLFPGNGNINLDPITNHVLNGKSNSVLGSNSIAGGQGSVSSGAWEFTFGRYTINSGNYSASFGDSAGDRGRWGSFCHGGGEAAGSFVQGAGQSCDQQLWQSGANGSLILTTDGAAPSTANQFTLSTIGSHYHMRVSASCKDTVSKSSGIWAAWDPVYGDADRAGSSTTIYTGGYSSASVPTRSSGSLGAATLQIIVDTNNAPRVTVTLPSGSDIIHCAAHVSSLEELQ
jgi:hypothetical protein